jgi:hypothetical protein
MLLYLLRAVRVSLMACEQMRSMIPDGIDHRPFPILFFYFYDYSTTALLQEGELKREKNWFTEATEWREATEGSQP